MVRISFMARRSAQLFPRVFACFALAYDLLLTKADAATPVPGAIAVASAVTSSHLYKEQSMKDERKDNQRQQTQGNDPSRNRTEEEQRRMQEEQQKRHQTDQQRSYSGGNKSDQDMNRSGNKSDEDKSKSEAAKENRGGSHEHNR
jgi:hypothetical protein